MKLRKWSLFLLVAIVILSLSACSTPQGFAQKVVELPLPIQQFIFTAVTLAAGWLLAQLAKQWPKLAEFLGPYVDEAALVVAGLIVRAIQEWLNMIPPIWEGVGNAALALIVAILAAYGFLVGARKTKYFLAARALTKD